MKTVTHSRPNLEPGEMVLHEGLTLVETDDPMLMVELLAEPRFKSCVVANLSPCTVLVRPAAAAFCTETLLKAGHTPKVSNE